MRAISIQENGPPSVMTIQDVPDPVAGPGEALIRVAAAGVNYADLHVATHELTANVLLDTELASGTVEELIQSRVNHDGAFTFR